MPAVMFAVVGVFFFLMIRNRPEDVGLPPVNVERGALGGSRPGRRRRPSSDNVLQDLEESVSVDRGRSVLPAGPEPLRVRQLAAGLLDRRPGRGDRLAADGEFQEDR